MMWFRIDNRLVHGQVVEAWLPYLRASVLVVVNDALALDDLKQQIMKLAIPERIDIRFTSIAGIKSVYDALCGKNGTCSSVLFLTSDCTDMQRIKEQGIDMPVINVGNIHYAPGKKQFFSHVALSAEEKSCLQSFEASGSKLDFRSVPGDSPLTGAWNA